MDLGSVAPAAGAEWIGHVPHEELERGTRPLLPCDDPFYDPPTGFEHSTPGTVLRSRDVELAFLGLIPQRSRATQLLYRTTDMHGKPDAAATTVIVPAERAPAAVTPVVSYQCAIDAVTSRCFPSYALRRQCARDGCGRAVRVPPGRRLPGRGLGGVGTRPRGPARHVGRPVRTRLPRPRRGACGLGSKRLGLSPKAPVGLWGYSGGGLASAWAAEMSGSYAPELNIVGAVLGSPVGDLGHTFRRLNGTLCPGCPRSSSPRWRTSTPS